MKKIVLFLILCVFLTGCSSNKMKGLDETGRMAYELEDFHFSLVIPDSWSGKYNYQMVESENGYFIAFYNVANRNAGAKKEEYLGELFVIQRYEKELWDYYEEILLDELPILLLGADDGYAYVMDMSSVPGFATEDQEDIQYSQSNDKLKEEFLEMANDIEAIAESFQLVEQVE